MDSIGTEVILTLSVETDEKWFVVVVGLIVDGAGGGGPNSNEKSLSTESASSDSP